MSTFPSPRVKRALLFAGLSVLLTSTSSGQFWQWSDHFGGAGQDHGYIGAVDQTGNVYSYGQYALAGPDQYQDMVIGNDTLHGRRGGFVAKHDPNGIFLWAVNCVASSSVSVGAFALDTANDVLIISGGHAGPAWIGNYYLPDTGAFLAWINTDGVCQDARNIGSSRTSVSSLVIHGGDIYVAGVTRSGFSHSIGGQTIHAGSFMARFQADGTQVWARDMITGFLSQTARFHPLKLLSNGPDLIVFGGAYPGSALVPFGMDTVYANVNPGSGGGGALISVEAETGTAQWIRLLGYGSSGGVSLIDKNVVDVDPDGNIYAVLYATSVSGDTVRFDPDTMVVVPALHGLPCFAKYGPNGDLLTFRTYGLDVALTALSAEESGALLMLATPFDASAVDVCAASGGLVLLRVDPLGNCLGSVQVASGIDPVGLSVLGSPDGIYLTATTPSAQNSTITFAGESVTSHGFEDVLLAKSGLSLGVAAMRVANNEQLLIYANPNNGSFRIRIPDALAHERHLLVAIHDGSGRLVYHAPLGMTDTEPGLDLHNLAPGLYQVTLGNAKRVCRGSMVVE